MKTDVRTLRNGLKILTIDDGSKTVKVSMLVKTGSYYESSHLNGISHYLEHMAFKGTKTRTYSDIAHQVELLGGRMNAYTSNEQTCYYILGASEYTNSFAEIIVDIISNSTFPEEEIETERGVILQEYHSTLDQPYSVAYNLHDRVAYGDSPYGRSIIGTEENIKRFSRDDILNYWKTHYVAEKMIFVVSGDTSQFDIDRFSSELEKIPQGKIVFSKSAPESLSGIEVFDQKFDQVTMLLSYPGENSECTLKNIDETIAIDSLGSGSSSPLFNDIREKNGLAYSIGSFYNANARIGRGIVYAQTTEQNLEKLFSRLKIVLDSVELTEDDVTRAKNAMLYQILKNSESANNLMSIHSYNLLEYGKIIPLDDYVEKIKSVTLASAQQKLKEMLSKKPVIALVGSGSKLEYYNHFLN